MIARMVKFLTCKKWNIDIPLAVEQIAFNFDKKIRCNSEDQPQEQFHNQELRLCIKVNLETTSNRKLYWTCLPSFS